MHSLYLVAPLPIILGAINLLLGQWYLMAARLSLFVIILVAYILNRHGHMRLSTNVVFLGSTITFGSIACIVPDVSVALKTTAQLFAVSVSAGSVIVMGLYAERRYQVDLMYAVALVASLVIYFHVGQTRPELFQMAIPVFLILTLCYAIARFEMYLSQLGDNQLKARRMLNAQLEEIHIAESLTLAGTERRFEEINHDIRNPLTVAMNTLKLLCETELTDKQSWYLETVEKSFSTVLSIADDWRKGVPDRPRSGSVVRRVQISGFFEQLAEQYRPAASAKGTSIRVLLSRRTGAVSAPLADLTRIVGNLVHNAVRYTENGRIDIHVSAEPSGSIPSGPALTIVVKDTGLGMDPRRLAEVRAGTNGPDRRESRSRGIGLRSSRALLEVHGGSLEIESREGAGTSVTVVIPLPKGEEDGAPEHQWSSRDGG